MPRDVLARYGINLNDIRFDEPTDKNLRQLARIVADAWVNDHPSESEADVGDYVFDWVARNRLPIGQDEIIALGHVVHDALFGFGPLTDLMQEESVTDIMINGPDSVWIERNGQKERTSIVWSDIDSYRTFVDALAGKIGATTSIQNPSIDGRLDNGARLHISDEPAVYGGAPIVVIRKHRVHPMRLIDLARANTLTAPMVAFLIAAVRARLNILIAGGTGSGKTTLLGALTEFIPPVERVVTIEDNVEIQIPKEDEKDIVRLEAHGDDTMKLMTERLRSSLRMNPDRIIVGECRGAEAFAMLQAMNTGHAGSMTTIHANNPTDAISRLETMVMMAGVEVPYNAVRGQIGQAINVLVQMARISGGRRVITSIAEVRWEGPDHVYVDPFFYFDPLEDRFLLNGFRPSFWDRIKAFAPQNAPDPFVGLPAGRRVGYREGETQ